MNCALCLQKRKLCRSHVVPRFLFNRLVENGNSYEIHSSSLSIPKKMRTQLVQHLLCDSCEQLLSRWEDYASHFFEGKYLHIHKDLGKHRIAKNAKYHELKLFLMSILWRFSITTNPFLRGTTTLGKHQEIIRRMLLASDPGRSWQYGCFITALTADQQQIPDLILPPSQIEIRKRTIHRMVIGGWSLAFTVASHNCFNRVEESMIPNQTGTFIVTFSEIFEIEYLADIINRLSLIQEGTI